MQTKLRCSNWKSRMGRWWNIPKVDRVSDLCCNDIDTELHYLFECHSHKIKEIRDKHIPNYYSRYLSILEKKMKGLLSICNFW